MKSINLCCYVLAGTAGLCLTGYSEDLFAANADASTSNVRGRVVLVGQLPVTEFVTVPRDSATCGEFMRDEGITVDPTTRGITGVVVSLEGVERTVATSSARDTIIESDHCRFVPRINSATTTSSITFKNLDPILHDAQVLKPNSLNPIVLNVMQPSRAPDVTKRLTERGVFAVRCNVHPFMHGAILVFDHPYFAITDTNGDFILPETPAGTYKLRLWHETLGVTEKVITVKGGEPSNVMIEMKRETNIPY